MGKKSCPKSIIADAVVQSITLAGIFFAFPQYKRSTAFKRKTPFNQSMRGDDRFKKRATFQRRSSHSSSFAFEVKHS